MSRTSIPANLKLGFLGAGQLARMSALEAFKLGIQVAVFSDRTENEPVQFMTPFSTSGSFDSVDDMVEFAKDCDVITLENEFISSEILQEVQDKSGTPIFPSPKSFSLIENKLIEKQTFENAGIPVTPYKLVRSESDLKEFGDKHGWPYLLKSSKGGYDGYGNETVRDLESAKEAFEKLGGNKDRDILAEAFVPFTKEIAVQVARNETGTVVYPCCETVQENHICVAVLSPAPIEEKHQKKAQELAVKAVEAIDGKGIYAFEFFLTEDGNILLNESAPRPHNSGHYSIEGCITSQFENHLRAVLGLPLGSTKMNAPSVAMINLLGTHNRPAEADSIKKGLDTENGHLHVYGKVQSKVGRKMAHYTLLGDDLEAVYDKAKEVSSKIEI
jgi:5-(carboxyamino)imidazole ribonucleotide synthase